MRGARYIILRWFLDLMFHIKLLQTHPIHTTHVKPVDRFIKVLFTRMVRFSMPYPVQTSRSRFSLLIGPRTEDIVHIIFGLAISFDEMDADYGILGLWVFCWGRHSPDPSTTYWHLHAWPRRKS